MPVFLPITLLIELYDYITIDNATILSSLEHILVILLIYLPAALLWMHFELVNKGDFTPKFIKIKKNFELNRKTGMVTLYKGFNKVRFSHPFIEFDCILVSAPNHQGLVSYNLYLVHRYKGYNHGVPLSSLMTDNLKTDDYRRLWNMVQQYMDTSRPMPDVLMLEAARELDPTTAEYDKNNPRKTHFWRKMTDEQFKLTLRQINNKQKEQLLTGETVDIFGG